jgi:hypothetical protein
MSARGDRKSLAIIADTVEAAHHRAAFERQTFGDRLMKRGRPFYDAARYELAQAL